MTRKPRDILTIGALADRYGVSAECLRLWEKQGLFPRALRTAGGHRRYTRIHVAALDRLVTAARPASDMSRSRGEFDRRASAVMPAGRTPADPVK